MNEQTSDTKTTEENKVETPPEETNAEEVTSDLIVTEPAMASATLPFSSPTAAVPPTQTAASSHSKSGWLKWVLIAIVAVVIAAMVGVAYWYTLGSAADSNNPSGIRHHMATMSATPSASPTKTATVKTTSATCTMTEFADKTLGLSFCYPTEWGAATVSDVRVSTDDPGYRQSISFSKNEQFKVGAVSEDWSTSVGRGVACLEPNNVLPAATGYDTDWNAVNYADDAKTIPAFVERSLPAKEGGYDMTESVAETLQSGVCVAGHKVINGSRFKTVYAGFEAHFSDESGITTPQQHMDNPNILFSETQRSQYDALLASMQAYE